MNPKEVFRMLKGIVKRSLAAVIAAGVLVLGAAPAVPQNEGFSLVKPTVADAAELPYVNWRQTDSRWSSIKLGTTADSTVGQIGCAATSLCCLLVESGACSDDESVFNPKIGINKMKTAGAFTSGGAIYWSTAASANSKNFKVANDITLSGSNAQKLATIKKYYDQGYYVQVKVVCGSQHWVAVRRFLPDGKCEIMDTGGTNQTYLSGYTISTRAIIYQGPNPAGWRYSSYSPGSVSGTYYLKNNSTGTYAYMNGKDANATDIALAAKKETDAYKMVFTPVNKSNAQMGSYIKPAGASRVVNPYADTPTDGTNVNLYTKNTDGTQYWIFDKVSGGYVIRNHNNPQLVLTAVSGSVKVKNYSSSNKAQIWTLESIGTKVEVCFHRNLDDTDTNSVKETFTTGVSNQKFGYKTDGTGRYNTMNPDNVGFGEWNKPGYDMLGWSKDKNASEKSWSTYSSVVDSWINSNTPSVDLYAVWKPHTYTVSFEPDGGYGTKEVTFGSTYGELPEPKKDGCRFVGWHTIDGEEITADSIYQITEDQTLYSYWLPSEPNGDCNADGKFDVADMVSLQKWLLAAPDAQLSDGFAADLCNDGVLNVYDIVTMRQMMTE